MNRLTYLTLTLLITSQAIAERPNILFIFTDDHAVQAIGAYGGRLASQAKTPHLDQLAADGMRFDRAFVTNSICAPSRAVVLTGRYSHLNGQRTNAETFDGGQPTFPKMLRASGYSTSLIGKWHLKSLPTGFDHYEVLVGQGPYYNPPMIRDGKDTKYSGYTTDIITDLSLQWLEADRDRTKPFMLMCQHKAPHGRWEPALRHLLMYDEQTIPEPATLFDDYSGRCGAAEEHQMGIATDMNPFRLMLKYSSKHTPQQLKVFDAHYRPRNEAFAEMNLQGDEETRWNYQRFVKNYLRCVAAVDENLGRLFAYLDESGLAKNTLVIYSSDQGFWLGEHGWFDKRWMYEESFRTPLIARWPGVIKPASVNTDMVVNLDYAATMLAAAGVEIPDQMQGRSLVPLMKGESPDGWRDTVYYHYYESDVHGVAKHDGVRTDRYKLIRFYELNLWELFDLEKDPREMNSVYDDPAYETIRDQMTRRLQQQRKLYRVGFTHM
jgi:arylsulfatase A-like enzyme